MTKAVKIFMSRAMVQMVSPLASHSCTQKRYAAFTTTSKDLFENILIPLRG